MLDLMDKSRPWHERMAMWRQRTQRGTTPTAAATAPPRPAPVAPPASRPHQSAEMAETTRRRAIADRLMQREQREQRTTAHGRLLTAYHEAGHALMCHLVSPQYPSVSAVSITAATDTGDLLGSTEYAFNLLAHVTDDDRLLVLASGAAAQRLYQSALARFLGTGLRLTFEGSSGDLAAAADLGFNATAFEDAIGRAVDILAEDDNAEALQAVADRLAAVGRIGGNDLRDLLRQFATTPARLCGRK